VRNSFGGKVLLETQKALLLCEVAAEEERNVTISVTLTPRARGVVEKLRADTGIPNTESVARLLEWFAGLDRKHRLALLNGDPATRAELARLSLEQMAAENGPPKSKRPEKAIVSDRPRP
jgi:hypothetical protein